MLLLDAFTGHLTPEVKSVIHARNTGLVVIPGGDGYTSPGSRCCSE
jgi:hypothetical protein